VETIELGDQTFIGSSIAKADCAKLYAVELYCGPKLFSGFIQEFEACGKEFGLACREFGKFIRPICPFDPIYVFDKIQLAAKVEMLQQRVEQLEVRRAK
jgi:hypothetical protein